jgi:hypothetical protein
MLSKSLGGRPKVKSDKELLHVLEEYLSNHVGEKIILSKLARETGIERYIWDYSKKAKEIIKRINNPIIIVNKVSDEIKTLPSAESLKEQSDNNPQKILEVYGRCISIINDLTEQVKKSYELEKKVGLLEKQIVDLRNENKKLLGQVKSQEKTMLELCIDSESLKKREEKQLRSNILTIDNEDIEKAIAVTDEDLKREFPWLQD